VTISSASQGRAFADTANNRASFVAIATNTSAQTYGITFTYYVK
jgi:hypothetical protein